MSVSIENSQSCGSAPDFYRLRDFIRKHREMHRSRTDISARVISLSAQHSKLGAFGGLGDFVGQTSELYPEIDWALPLTSSIRRHIGRSLGPAIATLPVTLFEPVTGTPYRFEFNLYHHRLKNNSLSWLFYNKELMEPLAVYKSVLASDRSPSATELDRVRRFCNLNINQNSYQHCAWTPEHMTLSNTPELRRIHPLLRRYIDNPDMLNAIMQSAMSKAVIELIEHSNDQYDVVWVHDWHFATTAGELLQTDKRNLSKDVYYVQHLHNALYQGIYSASELTKILGWPKSSERLYQVYGQVNLLGGALNALRFNLLDGKAVTVSQHHANELPSIERGAGLHHIFQKLRETGRLTGINNPITVPPNLLIKAENEIEIQKPLIKDVVQRYFGLTPDPEAFLLFWSHRFTQQKQVSAVLQAIETILTDGHNDLQIVFFCDIHHGSDPHDVKKLEDLIDRFPDNIATKAFNQKFEIPIAAGVDGALMASYFEPFGYAPVWVGMQGGFIITGANGGQVDIFQPETTFFIDIRPDIDKPKVTFDMTWRSIRDRWLTSNRAYRKTVFKHNCENIRSGILSAKKDYTNKSRRAEIRNSTMRRIYNLVNSDIFADGIRDVLPHRLKQTESAVIYNPYKVRICTDEYNSLDGPRTRSVSGAPPTGIAS